MKKLLVALTFYCSFNCCLDHTNHGKSDRNPATLKKIALSAVMAFFQKKYYTAQKLREKLPKNVCKEIEKKLFQYLPTRTLFNFSSSNKPYTIGSYYGMFVKKINDQTLAFESAGHEIHDFKQKKRIGYLKGHTKRVIYLIKLNGHIVGIFWLLKFSNSTLICSDCDNNLCVWNLKNSLEQFEALNKNSREEYSH